MCLKIDRIYYIPTYCLQVHWSYSIIPFKKKKLGLFISIYAKVLQATLHVKLSNFSFDEINVNASLFKEMQEIRNSIVSIFHH